MKLHNKTFEPFLSKEEIANRVAELGKQITQDYTNKELHIVVVLNGAFMFASDLVKHIQLTSDMSFIKVSSYQGTATTGIVRDLIGLEGDVSGKDILLIEDIVDTGVTLSHLLKMFGERGAKSIAIASLLFKREAYQKEHAIDYVGFEIPNKFVVGYGLDYDGLGRNIPEILKLNEN